MNSNSQRRIIITPKQTNANLISIKVGDVIVEGYVSNKCKTQYDAIITLAANSNGILKLEEKGENRKYINALTVCVAGKELARIDEDSKGGLQFYENNGLATAIVNNKVVFLGLDQIEFKPNLAIVAQYDPYLRDVNISVSSIDTIAGFHNNATVYETEIRDLGIVREYFTLTSDFITQNNQLVYSNMQDSMRTELNYMHSATNSKTQNNQLVYSNMQDSMRTELNYMHSATNQFNPFFTSFDSNEQFGFQKYGIMLDPGNDEEIYWRKIRKRFNKKHEIKFEENCWADTSNMRGISNLFGKEPGVGGIEQQFIYPNKQMNERNDAESKNPPPFGSGCKPINKKKQKKPEHKRVNASEYTNKKDKKKQKNKGKKFSVPVKPKAEDRKQKRANRNGRTRKRKQKTGPMGFMGGNLSTKKKPEPMTYGLPPKKKVRVRRSSQAELRARKNVSKNTILTKKNKNKPKNLVTPKFKKKVSSIPSVNSSAKVLVQKQKLNIKEKKLFLKLIGFSTVFFRCLQAERQRSK